MNRRNLLRCFGLFPLVARPMAKASLALPEPVKKFVPGASVNAISTYGVITEITITNAGQGYVNRFTHPNQRIDMPEQQTAAPAL